MFLDITVGVFWARFSDVSTVIKMVSESNEKMM
jgi:hypothetical protein